MSCRRLPDAEFSPSVRNAANLPCHRHSVTSANFSAVVVQRTDPAEVDSQEAFPSGYPTQAIQPTHNYNGSDFPSTDPCAATNTSSCWLIRDGTQRDVLCVEGATYFTVPTEMATKHAKFEK